MAVQATAFRIHRDSCYGKPFAYACWRNGIPIAHPGLFDARLAKPPLKDEEQIDVTLDVMRVHHSRIANTLQLVSGYSECGDYQQKLVFKSSGLADLTRSGFKPVVADALLILSKLRTKRAA